MRADEEDTFTMDSAYDTPPSMYAIDVEEDSGRNVDPPAPRASTPAGTAARSTSTTTTSSSSTTGGSTSASQGMNLQTIYLICLIFTIVAIFFFLLELVPMILLLVFQKDLVRAHNASEASLQRATFIATLIAATIVLCLILFYAIFSYGIGLILLVFFIPFVVSAILLQRTGASTTTTTSSGPASSTITTTTVNDTAYVS